LIERAVRQRLIASDEAAETLTTAELAMMRFARKVAIDASEISPADIDELKDHDFCEEEIFDIAASAAARSFFTKLLDTWARNPTSVT
jgi:alkylhydroperoxidase family enzyme